VKLKIALFCGHKSPYGLAHLMHIINEFDAKVVIIGTDERWDTFRQRLGGKMYYTPRDNSVLGIMKDIARRILPTWAIRLVRRNYRKHNFDNFREILRSRNIKVWEVSDINNEDIIKSLKKLDVDLFLSAAYPQIFSKAVLEIPKYGAVNFHPALLPKYRGAHPHFWQIMNGEKEGGLTAHFMTENIDRGDIIAQLSFSIEECSYAELYEKIIEHTPQLVHDVRVFFEKAGQARPQNPENATYYRNDREIHYRIFWNIHTSREIYNLIRTGRGFCFFRGQRLIFTAVYVTESNRNLTNNVRVEQGTIVDVGKDSISVKTIDGCINIREIVDGHKHLSFLQWTKKRNVYVGEKFD